MTDTPALAAFGKALMAAVDALRSLAPEARLQRIYEIASLESPSPDSRLADVLMDAAYAGSIDAAAVLIVLFDDAHTLPHEVFEALGAVVHRYSDLAEELVMAGLSEEIGGFLDAEVAAGRMVVRIDPTTGQKLYMSRPS